MRLALAALLAMAFATASGAVMPRHILRPNEMVPDWAVPAIKAVYEVLKNVKGTNFADLTRNGSVVCGTVIPAGYPARRFAYIAPDPVTMASQFDTNRLDTLLFDDDDVRVAAAIARVCP